MIISQKRKKGKQSNKKLCDKTDIFNLGNVLSKDSKKDLEISNNMKKATKVYHTFGKTLFGKKSVRRPTKRVY